MPRLPANISTMKPPPMLRRPPAACRVVESTPRGHRPQHEDILDDWQQYQEAVSVHVLKAVASDDRSGDALRLRNDDAIGGSCGAGQSALPDGPTGETHGAGLS